MSGCGLLFKVTELVPRQLSPRLWYVIINSLLCLHSTLLHLQSLLNPTMTQYVHVLITTMPMLIPHITHVNVHASTFNNLCVCVCVCQNVLQLHVCVHESMQQVGNINCNYLTNSSCTVAVQPRVNGCSVILMLSIYTSYNQCTLCNYRWHDCISTDCQCL